MASLAQHRIGYAGAGRLIIDQQGADAADALLAASMRRCKSEFVAQEVGEMHARFNRPTHSLAIHGQIDLCHASNASTAARRSAVK
jgi:hypothetical protein